MLNGWKTYIVGALGFLIFLADGLVNGNWNAELGAISLLAGTLRHAIQNLD